MLKKLTTFILMLTTCSAFALTTREIKNTTPLTDQHGNALSGVPITFTLVNKNRQPADCWVASTGERVAPAPSVARTNAFGNFSTSLVTTDQCSEVRYYLCHVESHYIGIADFIAPLDTDTGSLEWILFMAAGGTLTATGQGIFAAHTSNSIVHITPGNTAICTSANKGSIRHTSGGAGVADKFEACVKSSADAYAWLVIYTAP